MFLTLSQSPSWLLLGMRWANDLRRPGSAVVLKKNPPKVNTIINSGETLRRSRIFRKRILSSSFDPIRIIGAWFFFRHFLLWKNPHGICVPGRVVEPPLRPPHGLHCVVLKKNPPKVNTIINSGETLRRSRIFRKRSSPLHLILLES